MNTITCLDKKECCGCSACFQKCPKNAITMKENQEGFFYPVIDEKKCINCGLCVKVCPQLNQVKNSNRGYPKCYALYSKNNDTLLKSSSGGVFTEIANFVLENDGIVFGASYTEDFCVRHIAVIKKEEIGILRKSKYVQSDINNTYKLVEENLKLNKLVLFSGTPCQVFGLKQFLMKDYKNLITCDLVCHGVPSQKAFSEYLKNLSNDLRGEICKYDFRSKDIDGCEKIGKVTTKDGKSKYLKIGLDPYYNNFLEGTIFRESCYNCHYSNLDRVGDITIGDFIGVLEMQPEAYCSSGTSLCMINTEIGNRVFEKIRDNFKMYKTTEHQIKKYNSNLNRPKERPLCRDYIYKNVNDYKKFNKDLRKYMDKKSVIKSLIPIKIKNNLKKLRR